MPAFTTHYLLGIKMYQLIKDTPIKKLIKAHINPYIIGLQGPDIFFYNLFYSLHSDAKNIGKQMHETKSSHFFYHYLTCMERLNSIESEIALSYFLGFLCHYTLDTTIHPYVYARCNYKPNSNMDGNNSFGTHTQLESIFDVSLLKEITGLRPSEFHQSKSIHLTKREYSIISSVLTKSIEKTYHVLPSFFSSALCMKAGTFVLHDSNGFKKRAALFFETHILKFTLLSTLIETNDLTDTIDALNFTHKKWTNPWNTSLQSTKSFHDLVDDALITHQSYISSLIPYIYCLINGISPHSKRGTALQGLGNLSYHSGLPTDAKGPMG